MLFRNIDVTGRKKQPKELQMGASGEQEWGALEENQGNHYFSL